MAPIDLKTYVERERGAAARLARALSVAPVLISQWASGARPVPEDRAPSLELETNFEVRVETMCPRTRWHRVADPTWPNGKPLIDKTPSAAGAEPPAMTPAPAAPRLFAAIADAPTASRQYELDLDLAPDQSSPTRLMYGDLRDEDRDSKPKGDRPSNQRGGDRPDGRRERGGR